MPDIQELEVRAHARATLRAAYATDVNLLAEEICARIRRGEFDRNFHQLDGIVDALVRRHPRVVDEQLVLETISYSSNRNAVEQDFMVGWSKAGTQPWAKFVIRNDDENDELPDDLVLPPWNIIAAHAFGRDVAERIRNVLGDSPAQFVATRLGLPWDD